jgi:hypothetical protein
MARKTTAAMDVIGINLPPSSYAAVDLCHVLCISGLLLQLPDLHMCDGGVAICRQKLQFAAFKLKATMRDW